MDFNIYMPTRIIGGKDCVLKDGEVFSSFGKKCLIITSKSGALKSGALKDVSEALDKEGVAFTVFDEITENPLASACIKAGKRAREFNADFIIGIGGGSPLDASKAVAICAENPEYDIDGLYNREIPSKALPLILIGTTSGTGSEVTGVSVLTNDKTMMKKSISGADCYATVSFLDPKYTYSMPYNVTVTTVLDAFAHAVEGWFSHKCTDLPTKYAEMALPDIFKGLNYLYETKALPDEKMRDNLYYASIYAGLTLNVCGTAFPHTVGYILTEEFGVPHGKACTAFFPLFLEKAKANSPERVKAFLDLLKTDEETLLKIIGGLTDVKINADKDYVKKWCSRWGVVKNFMNTPGGFTNEEAEEAILGLG